MRELTTAQAKAQADGVGIWGLGKSIAPEAPAPGASAAVAPGAGASPQGVVSAGSSGQCHLSYDPCLPSVQDLD